MKPADVKVDSYNYYDDEHNKKDPNFKVGDHVRISKYKTFLQKDTHQMSLKKSL